MDIQNYVTKLNDLKQQHKWEVDYKDVESVGPDNIKTFTMRVVVNGKAYDGVGNNKKEAKQKAAENALRDLEEPVNATEPSTAPVITNNSYGCWLNDYSQKNKVTIRTVESTRQGPDDNTQCCSFVVGDKEYPAAYGKTKKEAKEEAAKLVYQEIHGIKTTETGDEKYSGASSQRKEELSEISIRSSLFESSFSTPTSVESHKPSKNMSMDKSDSIVFEDSANPTRDQDDVKNKRKKHSVSDASTQSRFTSEFDSIVLLGEGSFGRVFKARKKLLDKCYAIKIVDYREKALREVKVLSDLSHQHIVKFCDCWTEASKYKTDSAGSDSNQPISNSSRLYLYIMMELCDTDTLKERIKERNEITQQDSKRREDGLIIAQQIVSGVEYIHSRKLIHRDLKPANIMFGQDGEVKIGDFGLVTENDDDAENLLDRTVDIGTPSYMAPEQEGEKEKKKKKKSKLTYNHKVDIFALGLIYIELLWKVTTDHERGVILKDARDQKLPTGFKETFFLEYQMIMSMLCNKPEDRPEARTLKAELENLVQTYSKQQNMCLENATV